MKSRGILCAGQELVVTRWVGSEGSWKLAREQREQLLEKLPREMVDSAEAFGSYPDREEDVKMVERMGAAAWCSMAEGGIFGALWDFAELSGVGLRAELDKIPIRQETIEICEILGLNPYMLTSRGSLLIGTDCGFRLARELMENGIPGAVVGYVTEGRERVILSRSGKRFLVPDAQNI